jgi:hypothetical protein
MYIPRFDAISGGPLAPSIGGGAIAKQMGHCLIAFFFNGDMSKVKIVLNES